MLSGSFHCGAVRVEVPRKMNVNFRNFDPSVMESTRIRRLDGASTWKFLD